MDRFDQGAAVSIGKFECLHRGHQKLIENIKAQEQHGLHSTVIMIEPPSKSETSSVKTQVFTLEERRNTLAHMGINECLPLEMNADFRNMEAETFVKNILVEQLHVKYLTAGVDFRFGRERAGDGTLLKNLGKQYGFEVTILEKEMEQEREISSSWVRETLLKGDIEIVNTLLGYRYFISGEVEQGNHIGRRLGLPTVNIYPQESKLLPPFGVYASLARIDGQEYEGVTNIGMKPTVQEQSKQVGVETNLFYFHKETYGKKIQVFLCTFLRPERAFPEVSCLKRQILTDIAETKRYFSQNQK